MGIIQAYLPIDRRLALVRDLEMPDRVHGAALFADISGFTPLTAALSQELGSRAGAEAVIAELNRVFTALNAEVHRYGGAVINFGGDSITCWFDNGGESAGNAGNPQPPKPTPALRAVACGLDLQRVMRSLRTVETPGGESIPLGIKVAVASGPARRFLVGDAESYVLEVVAGTTLDRMAAAEKHAEPGEVIVTADVLEGLEATPAPHTWREADGQRYAVVTDLAQPVDSSPWPLGLDLPDTMARPWLLPPVYAHLRHGSDAFLAELRQSVTLFIKFSGIDYDADDAAGEKLDAYVCRVQGVLNRYEGYLLQVTMGDKGSNLIVSFGAPVAHENDAARAVAAALEICELTAAVPYLELPQIGISQGLAYSGAYGSPDRRTYSVNGNEVNISARLMSAAQPGQILISERVAAAVRRDFDIVDLPQMTLKGLAKPLSVAEVAGRRATASTPATAPVTQMVGRKVEADAIEAVLADLRQGHSSILIVEGEAGVGKSLLTQELMRKAGAYGDSGSPCVVLSGCGDAVERSTPYYPWRSIFGQLFDSLQGDPKNRPASEQVDQLLTLLDPAERDLAPLLNVVLPWSIPETSLTEQITGEARQDSTHRLLVSLLRSIVGEEPSVLILDDAQWLDSVSWALVRRVQRDIRPILLVLVMRPMSDAAPPAFMELRQSPAAKVVVLDTLPPEAIEQLIAHRLGVRSVPREVVRLIQEKAEGHPFFSEELAYALRDSGYIEIVDGAARLTTSAKSLSALDFPNSVQGVITSRIDLLPAREQLAVKTASVIGRLFAYRLLRDIYPVAQDVALLPASLDNLARLDITPQETPEPNLAYIFKHILTQEVVYGLMTSAQRRQLHHETALWYERAGEGDLNRSLPLMAHHYRLAGDHDKAVTYYGRAGENAFRDFANEEAIRFLQQALELSDEHTPALDRARWHRLSGEASYRLTLMEQSQVQYETALELLDRPIAQSTAGRGAGLTGALLRQVRHRALSSRSVGQAAGEERATLLELARVYEGVSEVYYNAGDQLSSFYCVMSALNTAERAGPSPELIRGYANMCATLGMVSLNSLAEQYRTRALTMAEQVDDPAARAGIEIPLSIYSLWIGAWKRAEEEIDVALDIYSQLREWRRWGVAAWVLPQVAQSQGQLTRAQELWSTLYDVARRSEDTRHQVRSRGGQFFNFLSLGLIEDALVVADQVGELLVANPEMAPVEERLWYGIQAARELQAGNWERARELAHDQMAAIDRARFKFDLLEVFAGPAEVLLSLWERGKATSREVEQGRKILGGYARTYPFARPRAARLAAQAALLGGKTREAEKQWRRSLELADSLGMPYEKALTQLAMAKALGDRAQQGQAAAALTDMGVRLVDQPLGAGATVVSRD